MSVYLVKGKGWRYDFTIHGMRYTETWFKTKRKAQDAEARKREEVKHPRPNEETPTDMTFLELVNMRLDQVKAYNAASHYETYVYMAKGWIKKWQGLTCSKISQGMIQGFVLERSKISSYTANRELRYLRATFNFGLKRGLCTDNPTSGIDFLPVEKKMRYVPPLEDVEEVLAFADQNVRDYLLVMWHTMARVGEINQLMWDDIDFENRSVVLWTRKKKGGHRTPRKVLMTQEVHEVLSRRYNSTNKSTPGVFYSSHIDGGNGELKEHPYSQYRRTILVSVRKPPVFRE